MAGLEGSVTVVTGAGRGIGHAIASRLAADGAAVAVADLDVERAEAVAAEISTAGGGAHPVQMDVADRASVDAAVAAVAATLGPVDILVNNAGWDRMGRFVDSDVADWDRIIQVNLYGVLHCCHAVVPAMTERGGGRIVNIASDAGRVGSSGEAVYSAAKGGIIAFTKTLARETARHGINVNCVAPGPTDTPMSHQLTEGFPNLGAALEKAIPFRRLAEADDIAGAVAFLVSDDAAYITGQTLSVNGGLNML
jgi:2-hydroxycyclohexanecarboxyl-CoA dehydrogenase